MWGWHGGNGVLPAGGCTKVTLKQPHRECDVPEAVLVRARILSQSKQRGSDDEHSAGYLIQMPSGSWALW